MWSLARRRLSYLQCIALHTQFADNVVMPRIAGTGIMAMIRMGATPMTLLRVISLDLDSVCASVLLGMSDGMEACMKHNISENRVSLKTSEDSPGFQLRSSPWTGMSSWNTGWQSRAPATAQWSEHPSARQGGTWNSNWNHARWERETAPRTSPRETTDVEQAPSSSSDSWQMADGEG